MSTLKVNTIQDASGSNPSTAEQLNQGRAKVWASMDGTGTPSLNDSFNCTSLADNGTGDYTLGFSISMANTNYCCTSMSENWEGNNNDSYCAISDMKGTRQVNSIRFKNLRLRFDQQPPQFQDPPFVQLIFVR